ncbi:MAG TPA: glycosyl transferase [Pseudomonas sp.]|nr:glycosyl transferase [Pseudomonas sp.]
MKEANMIPKIIHYVWIGDAPKNELLLRCIESWKKHLPDYEIKEWGNSQIDGIDIPYVRQALEHRKWAFASDYMRLFALHRYGGFYFDSDLEVTADIEPFREHDFVAGFEEYQGNRYPMSAFIGAVPNNAIIGDLLAEYASLSLVDRNGNLDLTANTKRMTLYYARRFGLKKPYKTDEPTALDSCSFIYPVHYFCTPAPHKKNFTIHHFNGSWLDGYARRNVLNMSGYTLCVFKDRKKANRSLPLTYNESLAMMLPLGFDLRLALLRKGTSRQPFKVC